MHKFTDYSFNGGFGFALDDLEHDRTGVYEAIAAFYADGGTSPILLSGTFGSEAWLVINKEILPFYPPGFPPPLMTGYAYYIQINEGRSPLTFEDSTVHNVLGVTRYCSLTVGLVSSPPVGTILVDSFIPFQKIFGDKAKSSWQTISGSATQFDYSFSFKKNILTNTLHFKGTITVKAGFTSASNYYWSMGTLPADCRPLANVPIIAQYRYHATSLKDSTNSDFIDVLNGEISTGGGVSFGLRRPDSSTSTYSASINTIIPLD